MKDPPPSAFSFDEADHLTRIHVKLALEDVGFAVVEQAETIHIAAPVPPLPPRTVSVVPKPKKEGSRRRK